MQNVREQNSMKVIISLVCTPPCMVQNKKKQFEHSEKREKHPKFHTLCDECGMRELS
jgi:hypothetical protein